MTNDRGFSNWESWLERARLRDLQRPGVYALAISPIDIAGTPFSMRQEIVYFGMTNAEGGLKVRLKKFDDTIKGGRGYGGAQRVRFKHPDYTTLTPRIFVSVCSWNCDVTSTTPSDLRMMGEVARYEYECFALFVEAFAQLPEFNDKRRSPKR